MVNGGVHGFVKKKKPINSNQSAFQILSLIAMPWGMGGKLLQVKLPGGYGMFHSLDPAVNVVKLAFEPLDGRFPGGGIGLIELLVVFSVKGDDRLHFQDQAGNDIHHPHRPEASEYKDQEDNHSHPEHAEVKVFGNSPANPHENASPRPVNPFAGGNVIHPVPESFVMGFAPVKAFVPFMSIVVFHFLVILSLAVH